ncbi:MAG: hypothetical protein EA401_02720 [Planctomycetota bacterium]|nr:MAG: hypothetical protein EA401_02720 [Planctomycetota bacterium]
MDAVQKEWALWGGGALLLVIILAVLTSSYRQRVVAANSVIDRVLPSYQLHYATGSDHAPFSEVQAAMQALRDDQESARREVEAVVLSSLPRRVIDAVRSSSSGRAAVSYSQVVDEIDNRYRSLRAKARRLNVGDLPPLPYEGADAVSRGDDQEHEQARSQQLAQVNATQTLVDLLIDHGALAVRSIEPLSPSVDAADAPSYLAMGVRIQASFDYANYDRLLAHLATPQSQVVVEDIAVAPERGTEPRFALTIGLRTVVPWPERWASQGFQAAGEPSAGERASGRGGRGRR